MDFNQIARIAKLVALIGFVLPWVTVSCSGTEILHATGWQLMTGDPQPAGPLAMGGDAQINEDSHPAVLVIAAFGVILIGLVCSLLTRKQTAAATMLAAALLGLGVTYYSVQNLRSEMQRSIEHEQHKQSANVGGLLSGDQQSEMGRAISTSITVEEEEGYWLTLLALVIAAVLSGLTLATRPRAVTEAPPSD